MCCVCVVVLYKVRSRRLWIVSVCYVDRGCTTGNVYKGLGGFGVLRHPPTQNQATHPDPPPPLINI